MAIGTASRTASGTVSAKGWVVIPQDIREKYNLKKGDKVHFIDYGGVISIIPFSKNPIEEGAGLIKGKTSLVKALLKSRKEDQELEK
jgi:AbrB family looped-hinge helix DNA binding protein